MGGEGKGMSAGCDGKGGESEKLWAFFFSLQGVKVWKNEKTKPLTPN